MCQCQGNVLQSVFLESVHADIDWIMGIKEPESGLTEYRCSLQDAMPMTWSENKLSLQRKCVHRINFGWRKFGPKNKLRRWKFGEQLNGLGIF